MTLYLLFEQLEKGRIALSTPLPVSVNASRQAPSKLGLRPGQTIEVEDAIKALVTKSANDVAVVVAEYLGGSEEGFAEMMTRKARALGMNSTVYRNASGLPNPEQITTARDLAILGRAIQDRFPRQYKYFQTRVFHYATGSYRNHNKLLGRVEGVDGIKTGFTRASGFNLLTSAKTDDRHIVAVVLGGRSGAVRDGIMASLVSTNLPRAYAGGRMAPVVAEVSDVPPRPAVVTEPSRPRPAVVTEAARSRDPDVETTAGTAPRQPLDLNAMRPVTASAGPTTTPGSILRWSAAPQPVPQAAQAYAPVDKGEAKAPPVPSTPIASASPQQKIEARLPAAEIVIAKAEAAEPRSEPVAKPALAASPAPAAPVSAWVIQLGAVDDESKAQEILEEARSRSRRVLAKASPFTEKVVLGGATLYRARFSGFDEADTAHQACKVLKRSGFACFATRG
jgi:D-alanyl-D-alanine carboxypeptidase